MIHNLVHDKINKEICLLPLILIFACGYLLFAIHFCFFTKLRVLASNRLKKQLIITEYSPNIKNKIYELLYAAYFIVS